MSTDAIRDIDDALDAITSAAGKSKKSGIPGKDKSRSLIVSILLWILKAVLIVVLPFLVLIRIAVTLHLSMGWNSWLALALSAVATTILLAIYVAVVTGKLGGKKVLSVNTLRFSGAVVAAYCIYTLVFISGANTKSDGVRDTYHSLHPLIRLSVSTLILVDTDLVVTDAARTRADYARMGLPALENSRHFEQGDGYVHAIDIRTVGIPEWQNALVVGFFRFAGFNTLRHTGTADHLHVSLP